MSERLRVAAAVVWRDGRLLMTQRPPGGPLGLRWELPGGKIEAGETPERALARELREELGVEAVPGPVMAVHSHDYPHGLQVELVFLHCDLGHTAFVPSPAVYAIRWVAPDAIDIDDVLDGDREFLQRLASTRPG